MRPASCFFRTKSRAAPRPPCYTGPIIHEGGSAMQTIREYADRGMIAVDVDEQNRYRYFE